MTQGEQQHSGIASAATTAVKEPRCQFEQADGVEPRGTSSSSSSLSRASSSLPSSPLGQGEDINMSQMPTAHLRHRQLQQQHNSTTSEHGSSGDVRTLLHFVNLASDDIKAALDGSSSSSSINGTSANTDNRIDSHPMYAADSLISSSLSSPSSSPTSFPPNLDKVDNTSSASSFDFRFLGNSVAAAAHHQSTTTTTNDLSRDFTNKTCAVAPNVVNAEKMDRDFETKSYKPDMLIMDVPLKDHLQMSSDLNFNSERSSFDAKRGGGIHGDGSHSNTKPHGLILPFQEDKKDCSPSAVPRDNPVPLRKRRLPASFWQEPGKSENHKPRQEALSALHPSQSASSSLQFPSNLNPNSPPHNFSSNMPLMSPLTLNQHHHSESSRLGGGHHNFMSEKGYLYHQNNPLHNNNDSCCSSSPMSNLGLSFHYASNSSLPVTPCLDSLQHRSLALSHGCGSLCSCHLHNNNNSNNNGNYFYEHHGMYSRSQGEFSSLLNSAAAAAAAASSPNAALSRWHNHAQSLHAAADARDLCHHAQLPRVLKPIATKTMSSYPPRFHPIFTWRTYLHFHMGFEYWEKI